MDLTSCVFLWDTFIQCPCTHVCRYEYVQLIISAYRNIYSPSILLTLRTIHLCWSRWKMDSLICNTFHLYVFCSTNYLLKSFTVFLWRTCVFLTDLYGYFIYNACKPLIIKCKHLSQSLLQHNSFAALKYDIGTGNFKGTHLTVNYTCRKVVHKTLWASHNRSQCHRRWEFQISSGQMTKDSLASTLFNSIVCFKFIGYCLLIL